MDDTKKFIFDEIHKAEMLLIRQHGPEIRSSLRIAMPTHLIGYLGGLPFTEDMQIFGIRVLPHYKPLEIVVFSTEVHLKNVMGTEQIINLKLEWV